MNSLKNNPPPLLIIGEDHHCYLQHTPDGYALYLEHTPSPLFNLKEPVELIQGVAASSKDIHLAFLKTNGDLCYTIVPYSGEAKTTVLAKLDMKSVKYRRLILLPVGHHIHIFYAYSRQLISELWHIEHHFWNGINWKQTHMGKIIHPREPLYNVSIDSKNNLHLLMITYYARKSLLMTNRFNSSFQIWGTPAEALTLPNEVIDMTSIMTFGNVHHLFWAAKTASGQLDVGWASRSEAHDFSTSWVHGKLPLQALNTWHGFGSAEAKGNSWLLINSDQVHLMFFEGQEWIITSTLPSIYRPLQISKRDKSALYSTYWLEDNKTIGLPLFKLQLGLDFQESINDSDTQEEPTEAPETDKPAITGNEEESSSYSSESERTETEEHMKPEHDTPSLNDLGHSDDSVLDTSDFNDSVLDDSAVSTDNASFSSDADEEAQVAQAVEEALEPFLKTLNALESAALSLTSALEALSVKNDQTLASLVKVEEQLLQIQQEQDNQNKKGFWSRWFT